MVGTDWTKLDTYLASDAINSGDQRLEPPLIATGELFAFEKELIDPQGNAIESEHAPAPFIEWLEGLKPQSTDVSYSGQKAPYLLAVYEAVPEWLGCSVHEMKKDYGYTPEELSDAFASSQQPSSKVIDTILNKLVDKAQRVIMVHENNEDHDINRPDESPS